MCTCIYFCSAVHMWMEVSVYSRTNCWISWCWNYSGKQPVWMLGSKRGPFEEQDMWWTTEPSLQPQVLYILIYSVPSHGRNKWECFKFFHMIFPVKWGSSNGCRMPTAQLLCIFKRNIPRTSESISMICYWIICPIISVCSTLNVGQSCSLDPICNYMDLSHYLIIW